MNPTTKEKLMSKLLKLVLSPAPLAVPDDFVDKVMQKIGQETPGRAAVPRLRWFFPLAGAALATLLLQVNAPSREAVPVTDNLLVVGDATDASTQWIYAEETPEPDDLIGLSLEDI